MSSGIVFFHTAESNIALFEDAARAAGFDQPIRHELRADLLRDAQAAGGLTDEIRARTHDALAALGADKVVCTCSTIGPGADDHAATGADTIRVDWALAKAALAGARRVAVLFAVATTEGPTRDLFENVKAETGSSARIDMVHVPGAWNRFLAGDADGYARAIANCADTLTEDYDCIALAQASMAPAAELSRRTLLTSPGVIFRML